MPGGIRIALVGSPNSGKSTLFNALTGLRAKTGNYPGVTVARYEGALTAQGRAVVVEDLPGTYSLDPISPDEQIVTDLLDPQNDAVATPDGLVVTLDATSLRRSLGLLSQVLGTELPVCVVLTFADELARRSGSLDVDALRRKPGVGVVGLGIAFAAIAQQGHHRAGLATGPHTGDLVQGTPQRRTRGGPDLAPGERRAPPCGGN